MKVVKKIDGKDIASVYIAENKDGKLVEFVESTQPPLTFKEKWVLIVSTLYGCPVDCQFCDAGGKYQGKLSTEELLFQVDYPVKQRFGGNNIETEKFKIQFARMGEPSFNMNVIEALREIPNRFVYKQFIPSLSTIGPHGVDRFFEKLLELKKDYFSRDFQLQFSIHSTDIEQRDKLIPVRKMNFEEIAVYGEKFYDKGGKKITLNFALGKDSIVDVEVLKKYFDPSIFLIKITPVNPTVKANTNKIESLITIENKQLKLLDELSDKAYQYILSIGEWEENKIGSNCGQYVNSVLEECRKRNDSYTYQPEII